MLANSEEHCSLFCIWLVFVLLVDSHTLACLEFGILCEAVIFAFQRIAKWHNFPQSTAKTDEISLNINQVNKNLQLKM